MNGQPHLQAMLALDRVTTLDSFLLHDWLLRAVTQRSFPPRNCQLGPAPNEPFSQHWHGSVPRGYIPVFHDSVGTPLRLCTKARSWRHPTGTRHPCRAFHFEDASSVQEVRLIGSHSAPDLVVDTMLGLMTEPRQTGSIQHGSS